MNNPNIFYALPYYITLLLVLKLKKHIMSKVKEQIMASSPNYYPSCSPFHYNKDKYR